MAEKFDAIVIGAGPSGNSAAYVMAKAGLNVLQLERGEYPGSKNVQGAILYADALERIIPEFRDEAPLERHIIEQRVWVMDDRSYIGSNYRSEDFNEAKPNRYTIIRAQFDRWFSSKVKEAGALVICDTVVKELLKDDKGRVIGVTTDRDGGEIYADVVVLADGVNSMLARKAGFHGEISGKNVALAVKEMHFLPAETIQARFNIGEEEGVVIEMMGKVTHGKVGTGFLYTNKESLAIGIGCMVDDFKKGGITPYQMLDELKQHPVIKPLLAGSEVKEYAAHLIPEGGYNAIPKIYGDGWVIVGDSGGFVNAVHREGSNLAMTTGRVAAETIVALKAEGKALSAANLVRYKKALDESFVMKDMKKYKDIPEFLDQNRQFFTTYPELLSKAATTLLRVDGTDKLSKEKQITKNFRRTRTLFGMVGDAVKLARALR